MATIGLEKFWKIITSTDFKTVFRLDADFANSHEYIVGDCELKDKTGNAWTVKATWQAGYFSFVGGWQEFCRAHHLQLGKIVLFEQTRFKTFVVSVYGRDGKEIVNFTNSWDAGSDSLPDFSAVIRSILADNKSFVDVYVDDDADDEEDYDMDDDTSNGDAAADDDNDDVGETAESGAVFINVRISNIMSKWLGDAEKLVSAVFSLAHKLQPAIIFIDEVDSFLSQRKSNGNEILNSIKTIFMSLWDGFATDKHAQVMVLAATNRPSELDEAILRRFPQSFEIGMPNHKGRVGILKVVLKGEKVEDGIDFDHLASLCEGYSGSDLIELCKKAAYLSIQDFLDDEKNGKLSRHQREPRPLLQSDLESVIATSTKTKDAASEYGKGLAGKRESEYEDQVRWPEFVVPRILNLQLEPPDRGSGGVKNLTGVLFKLKKF